jgi:energy-coupling factor transport system ATP-binding protein
MLENRLFLENLRFAYRTSEQPALDAISAQVERGEFIVIMGGAGSGKSSLSFALAGVIPHVFKGAYSGRVVVDGVEIAVTPPAHLSSLVGLVMQDFEAQLLNSSVESEVAFGLENLGFSRVDMVNRVAKYLEMVNLASRKSEHPAVLSGGQKQQLAIASIIATQPSVIVLDEPTTDLDPSNREGVLSRLEVIKSEGTTLFITGHDPETALLADTVWVMSNGKLIAAGPPAEIMTDLQRLRECAIHPPELVSLMDTCGFSAKLWTIDEAVRAIRATFKLPGSWLTLSPPLACCSDSAAVLQMVNVTYKYRQAQQPALEGVSLTVDRGEFVAVVGHNGSGKTTLLKHLIRLLKPQNGQVRVFGRRIESYARAELARTIGLVFQNPDQQIFAATVFDELSFSLQQFGLGKNEIRSRVEEALEAVGLSGYENRDPVHLTRGERQRIAVASVLVTRPDIVLLDEPTKGLDYNHRASFLAILSELHKRRHTVVMSTHSMSLVAASATRVIVLNNGRVIADGPTRDTFRNEAAFEAASLSLPKAIQVSNRLGLNSVTLQGMAEEINGHERLHLS